MRKTCKVCKSKGMISMDGYCISCALWFTGSWFAIRPTKRALDGAKRGSKSKAGARKSPRK